MFYRLCRVREISPGTHTFFPTYTCPVYCWRSVQLLDFGLCCNLIHASQPIRTTFTGQCFAYGFLQTSPRNDALAFSCILPTAGRIRDFHPLERAPAGRTTARMSCCSRTFFVLAGYGCWDAICLTGMNFETGRDPFSGGIEGLMGQLFRDRIIRYLPNGGSKPRRESHLCILPASPVQGGNGSHNRAGQAGRAKKYLLPKRTEAISIASVHRTHENEHG